MHTTSSKQWTEEDIKSLPNENGYRMRGLAVTRLDTLVDAAFAFVLTLLVISFDELPSNRDEMIAALKLIPAFAASFIVLMMFWSSHRNWSRRFGLENKRTMFCSLALIFVVLVYVYPLRMIFEGLFSQITNNFLPTSYYIDSYDDIRLMFIFYSAGFIAMTMLVVLLYTEALNQKKTLLLNSVEQRKARIELQSSLISISFGILSVLIAVFAQPPYIVLAGYVYFGLIPFLSIPKIIDRRRHGDLG
jgi:uncharacterized membrane protein